jgi:hypothetical protein
MEKRRLKSAHKPKRCPALASPSIHASSGATCFDSSSQLRPGASGGPAGTGLQVHGHQPELVRGARERTCDHAAAHGIAERQRLVLRLAAMRQAARIAKPFFCVCARVLKQKS